MTSTASDRLASARRKIPIFGSRRLARRLAWEIEELSEEVARLHSVVRRYGIQDALQRRIALDDLSAEQMVQERRLRDLLDEVHYVESQRWPSRSCSRSGSVR